MDEVRRCARCGEATLLCVHRWQHQVLGVATAAWTLDFECRSCGAKVTLHPQRAIRIERIFAYVMLPALFPGLYFLASARRKARAWTDNPVATGAPPAPRPPGPPDRACACGGAARCTEVGRKQTRWVELGKRYEYTCVRCASELTVHDVRSIVSSMVGGGLLVAAGALVVLVPPGAAVGADRDNRWFGVALLVLGAITWLVAAVRIRRRLAHPVVRSESC